MHFSLDKLIHLIPGAVIYMAWIVCMMTGNSFIVAIFFTIISVGNSAYYFTKTQTKQIFYTPNPEARTIHAHRRTVYSGAKLTWRTKIGAFLRGKSQTNTANRQCLQVVELDIWTPNQFSEGLFIFLSPFTMVLQFLGIPSFSIIIASIVFAFFFFFLVSHINASIEDQRILGEELYKTQSRMMRPVLAEQSHNNYCGRVLKRVSAFKSNGIPEEGPGIDLEGYFRTGRSSNNDYYSSSESESEYSCDESTPKRSPFKLSRVFS